MDTFVDFVQNWGYLAVFLGSLIEGESVILTASAMARLGHLNIFKVGIIAFAGTLIADQLLYFVGWFYGDAIFERFPKLKENSVRAFEYLHKYDARFIIASRFIYGIRITSSIVIGAAKVKPTRYVPLNFISAVIWAVVSCGGGYLLGEVMLSAFQYFELVQKYIFYAVIGVLAFGFSILKIRHYSKNKKK
ncbi:MAG: DedA family protein [Candidatus Paracaedibacteraceae bacterium]|nr:DedA family protein [Candidatus Paracaedibacteraceae bacterium]